MTMGQIIGRKRRDAGLTQESLAGILGVTNQAVSKWESDQCYPDIALLPRIADQFGITIDALFDRTPAPLPAPAPAKQVVKDLPWEDDSTIRAVVYQGHTLMAHMNAAKDMTFTFVGEPVNVDSAFSVHCGDVAGNVDAGGSVTCTAVGGNVDAGGSVTCGKDEDGSVGGGIDAGGSVHCGAVTGDVDAGGSVTCQDVGRDVDAGGSVQCRNVGGNVDAGSNVTCSSIAGKVDAARIIIRTQKE